MKSQAYIVDGTDCYSTVSTWIPVELIAFTHTDQITILYINIYCIYIEQRVLIHCYSTCIPVELIAFTHTDQITISDINIEQRVLIHCHSTCIPVELSLHSH